MKPTFFRTAADFRKWLMKNHATRDVLLVGFHKKGSGKPSITWPQSVDQALCFGWIDGVRKRIDETSYTIRFTPRRPASIWSNININRAQALIAEGQMQSAGLKAYEARRQYKSGIYAYEQRTVELPEPYNGLLKKNKVACSFFEAQPPGYRKLISWWIASAKKEETRSKRFDKFIAYSIEGKRL